MSDAKTIELHKTIEGADANRLVPNLAAAATGHGIKAEAPVPGTLMLSRRFLPHWAIATGIAVIVAAVVLGSLGAGPVVWLFVVAGALVMIFVRQTETVSLVVTDTPAGARVDATGVASGKLEEFVGGLA